MSKKIALGVLVVVIMAMCNGCALLSIPGQVIGGTFSLLKQLFGIANSLPKPPPGIFF